MRGAWCFGRSLRRFFVVGTLFCSVAAPGGADAEVRRGRGWLGIAMDAAGAPAAGGVHVDHVVRGSPADKAGIREGDRVLRVLGRAVATPRDVIGLLSTHPEGEAVALTLGRVGKEVSFTVTLAPFPSGDEMLRMDKVGVFAPAWVAAEPLSGAPASMGALRGKVVIVDFWATWCGPCRELAPALSGLQARYGAQGLTVVGITTDPAAAAATFKERVDMRYPLVIDPRGETSRVYGVSALPTMFVVDKRGVIRDVDVGYDPESAARLEVLVRGLLAEPAP